MFAANTAATGNSEMKKEWPIAIMILQADQGRAFGFNGEEPDLLNRTLSVPG